MQLKTKLSLALSQRWQQRRLGRALLLIGSLISSLYWIVLLKLATTASSHTEVTAVESNKRNYELSIAQKYSPSEIKDSMRANMKPKNNKEMSSVDYMACCGAGHRISKSAEANYLAKILGFSLRTFWGYCDTTEVFHYLFGPQLLNDSRNATEYNEYARINNDVPGFMKLIRKGPDENCSYCSFPKAKEDVRFYTGLRQRFRRKNGVETFRQVHFSQKNVTIIGMHIRAGNGESGDFAGRGRAILHVDEWLRRVVAHLVRQKWGSADLFLATDTPSMIAKLQKLLEGKIPVVHLNQNRPVEGAGVLFGERGKVVNIGQQCLKGWEDTFMDMILLSHADVVIAARPSSFTQSMPLSLVLATPKESRKVSTPFCELNPDVTDIRCYEDFREWCCQGTTSFVLDGIQQKYEYLRMPPASIKKEKLKIRRRPLEGCIPRPSGFKQTCLPYDWSEFKVEPLPKRKKPRAKTRPFERKRLAAKD